MGAAALDQESFDDVEETIAVAIVAACASAGTAAQNAEPSYRADPKVYRVIFEDANFRAIGAVGKAGVRDKTHGHPVPSIVYAVMDCKSKLYGPSLRLEARRISDTLRRNRNSWSREFPDDVGGTELTHVELVWLKKRTVLFRAGPARGHWGIHRPHTGGSLSIAP